MQKSLVILVEIKYNVSIGCDTMREAILDILKNSDKALDIYELQDMLNVSTVENTTAMRIAGILTETGICIILEISWASPIPEATPTRPPKLVSTAASVKN